MITSNTCTIKSKHGSFLTVHSDGSATFGAETAESIFRLPSPLTHLQSIAHGTFLGQVDGNIAFASPIISPITAITRAELLSPTAQFVHAILSAEGYGDWAAADPSTVVIDELSGYAGSATYKVSAHGANPVVLHTASESAMSVDTRMAKLKAAQALFAQHNVGVARICSGDSWWIDPFVGVNPSSPFRASFCRFLQSTAHSGHVTAWKDGKLWGKCSHVKEWERFSCVSQPGEGRIALQSWHNAFIAVDEQGSVSCTSQSVGDKETFLVVPQEQEDVIALKGCNGKYVSILENGTVCCTASSVGTLERVRLGTFKVEEGSQVELRDLVKALARIHKIPTAWFEPFREGMRKQYPLMETVDHENHLWVQSGWAQYLFEGADTWVPSFFHQLTKANKRRTDLPLVTTHGDLHFGNMLRTVDGLCVAIDLESACVASASEDLVRAMRTWGPKDSHDRRELMRLYLEEMELPATPADVDDYLFKVCIEGLSGFDEHHHCHDRHYCKSLGMPFNEHHVLEEIAARAYHDETLRAELIEAGRVRDSDTAKKQASRIVALRRSFLVEQGVLKRCPGCKTLAGSPLFASEDGSEWYCCNNCKYKIGDSHGHRCTCILFSEEEDEQKMDLK